MDVFALIDCLRILLFSVGAGTLRKLNPIWILGLSPVPS